LNQVIARWLKRGAPQGWQVIWATGRGSFGEYAPLESERVRVRPYLSPIADAYAATDLALARAGAMTTAELCAWGIPSLLVPLPTAAADHQTANARALANAGAAIFLDQRELSAERLDVLLGTLRLDETELRRLARAAQARGRPDAAQTIADRILSYLGTRRES
jgi:UDP-N-acetylglucosamine--N-acetylmuramyl-(pentapeptide) pyrophosphoryl-undecaprenol N-acetylglucosamine transferase